MNKKLDENGKIEIKNQIKNKIKNKKITSAHCPVNTSLDGK